jgi:signal transduction histidine kinase
MDRLRLLWRVTLGFSLITGWIVLNVAMLQRSAVSPLIIPLIILSLGSLIIRSALAREAQTAALWSYIAAIVTAQAIALLVADAAAFAVLAFVFPILMFIIGLLVPPRVTLLLAVLAVTLIFVAPIIGQQAEAGLSLVQLAAIVMTVVGAGMAALVSGDLYQIADWALANYQRERRVAGELFASQQALETSLARSTALSERLQETNRELERARAAAEEAKHFRGQFLANMSHELRTPLNSILGFSETMLKFPAMYDDIPLPPAYETDLQQISTSGHQLLALINDILDLAKVDAGKLEVRMRRVELAPLLRSVSSTASGLIAGKPIELERNVPEQLPAVWGDETRVRQVLLNLYSNAAKFTDRGTITLDATATEAGVCITVTDTGTGISTENLDIIFEEFQQAENGGRDPRSGAGLGLAISRQLMTLMGGRIWAESEVGKGSTFHLLLQAYPEAVAEEKPAAVASVS